MFPSAQQALHFTDAFFRNTLTCLALLDKDFNFIQVNDAYAKACGRPTTDFPGHNHFEFYPSDAQAIFETVRETKIPYEAIARPFTFPDHPEWGVTYWDWTLEPILDSSGDISFFMFLLRDVTGHKQAEEHLEQVGHSMREAMRLLDATRDGLFIFEKDTLRFTYVNQGAILQTGYSWNELLHMTPLDLKPHYNLSTFRSLLEPLATGRLLIQRFETMHCRKDGSALPVEILLQYAAIEPATSRFIAVVRDMTTRKEAETQLQQSEQFLSSVLEHLPSMVFVKNADDLRFVKFNKAGEDLLGYSRHELLGHNDYDFFPQEEADFFTSKDREVLTSGQLIDIAEETIQTRNNGLRILHTKKIPIFDEHGKPRYLLGLSEDITERKHMESQLSQSEERFRRLIEVSSQLVWGADARGHWCGDFTSWEKFTGHSREESAGWRWLNAIHPDDRIRVADTWRDAVKKQAPCSFEVRVRYHHGGYRDTICHATPLFNTDGTVREWIGMNIDITEHKLAEDRLRQASRLEAIGKLAGGIAHDFNNLLTVIKGYNEMMLLSVASTDPLHATALEMKCAADRAAMLTQQLLTFSRHQTVQPQILQLNNVIHDLASMLRRLIGEHIQLVTSLEPRLHSINIDRTQIEQIIVNLVVNARDAMPNGGTLTIETTNVTSVTNGPSVRLAVRDTGVGIDDSALPHIFEPFYTTKSVGHGTGLGLAVVYGIVTKNGGRIRVQSHVNQGATFIIKFPSAVAEPIETAVAAAKSLDQAIPSTHRGETILLTEDDDAVRRYLKHTLTTYDYQVLEAASPAEALRQAQRFGDTIQLLVTDMVMPGMNGQELAARISDLNPAIKVLLISGYTDTMDAPHNPPGSPIHFLDKPFTPNTFAHMVRHILDERAHPARHDCLNGARS